ncbi:MAG: hypothetical protein HDR03_14745 [Lachnospiraceae bacterium]|nr:hypothetical protein [Lachnospiraceae bacterium]
MDTFIDRLSHKKSSQEMIQANAAADAAKMEQLQNQVAEYDTLIQKQSAEYDALIQKQSAEYDVMIQDMRKVNLRAAENMDKMQQMLEAALKKIEAVKEADSTQADDAKAELEQLFTELKKQMEEISMRSDDFQHKENVKVYRNVQASMAEELEKQTSTISQKISEGAKKQSALLPVSIIIMLMVIIDIVINLFNIVIKF